MSCTVAPGVWVEQSHLDGGSSLAQAVDQGWTFESQQTCGGGDGAGAAIEGNVRGAQLHSAQAGR